MTQASSQTSSPISSFELAALAANIAESKKAADTLVLDTGKVSYLADYFVICTGDSTSQLRTITEEIRKTFRKLGQEPMGSGQQDASARWSLLDYGDVVVHVFHRTEREFYQLENFWSHSTEIPEKDWRRELDTEALRQVS